MSSQQSGAKDSSDPDPEQPLPTQTVASSEAIAGTIIGAYHLLQPIGQGGMGEVWLAEQKQPVRRRVAIKLVKAGMDTREVVARFESERQALALMDHPAIAKVFDAGSTPQGRPYFVMEYVTGIPITEYCDKHKMTLRERLELFIHVCEGVQHAHQKAIIHRDLKPSNILVGEVDGKPVPRIIDFGVAKATSQRLTAETLLTRVGSIIGTPEYMSPEQADSAGEDIDTCTDVYSLGVVLYELLVGALPLEFGKLPLPELLHKLRDEDAPRPSTKLRTTSGEQSATAARNRRTDAPTLSRQLRGDLDAITLKALEKERSRRYATPTDLAADIGRYLRNEPVLARPTSAGYRARKYMRRHRIGVAIAGAGVLLLASFAILEAVQLRRIKRESEQRARVTEFMTNMFKVSDPSEARGNSITAREILDKASKEIDTGLAKDPEVQAQMMHVMGTVYNNLGLYQQAQSLLTRSVEIRRRLLGPQNANTLSSMNELGWTLQEQGRFAKAEELQRETLAIQRRVFGPEQLETLRSMRLLAATLGYEGRYSEAEQLQREALDVQRRVLGSQHPDTLRSMGNLANYLFAQGRYAEAEKLQSETVDTERRVLGSDHPTTLVSMGNLALVLSAEGRYVETEKLHREALDIQRRVLGSDHPDTLRSIGNLGDVLFREGRYEEAEKLQREAWDIRRRVLGPDHPDTALSTYNLGCIALRNGKPDQALLLLRESIDHGLAPYLGLAMEKDPDLQSLHGDPRFAALVAHAKERVAAAQKPH